MLKLIIIAKQEYAIVIKNERNNCNKCNNNSVLGVIALLAILGLFMGVWTPAKGGTSLQAATQATCAKINPIYCKEPCIAARMPVYDFDANKNGILNEHAKDNSGLVAHNQDNFVQLCYNYYGVPDNWGIASNVKRCLVDVCGCPNYNVICP
ncbi:MAG: hypothetical protein QW076_05345 [Candidatus Anstonellales archaeon]